MLFCRLQNTTKKARVSALGFSIRGRRFKRLATYSLPLILTILIAALCHSLSASNARRAKNVLVLYSYSDRAFFDSQDALESAVRARVHAPVNFRIEYMESERFRVEGYEKSLSDLLHYSYSGERLDLVIVAEYPALQFAVSHRAEISPGVPILFSYVFAGRMVDQKLPPGVTGVTETVDVPGSLNLAFRLNPDTKNVAVVAGTSEFDRFWLAVFHSKFPPYADRAKLIDLAGLPTDELMRRVFALPPHTVVFFQAPAESPPQPAPGTHDTIAAISMDFPTYCIFSSFCMDHGGIGGSFADSAEESIDTADLASRILSGEKPENLPVAHDSGAHPVVDWRQLHRWNISESALPAGSVVLYRQPTFWKQYQKLILGSITLLVLQALLIFYLLWQRAKRQRAEESLVEQLAFEHLVSELSTTFINLQEEQVDSTMEKGIRRIAEFLGVDRITVHEFSGAGADLRPTHSWRAEGNQPVQAVVQASQVPWWTSHLLRGETVLTSDLDALPEEASAEREYLRKLGVISVATVPLRAGDEFFGSISFLTTKRRVVWPEELVQRLKIVAEIFSNALMRARAEKARFRHAAIVESSDDAIISMDLEGTILSWNPGAQRLFEYTEAEVIGKSIAILIPPELQDEEKTILRRLSAGGRVEHHETIRVTKEGKRLDVSLTISPIKDSMGRVVGISKIARDITARKQAEQVLRESEERFRLVADTAPALIWMSGTDKLCTFFNRGWLEFTGQSMEHELGEGWASGVHPEDMKHCLRIYSEAFNARVKFEMEYRLRRFDGEYRWMVDYGVPRFEPGGGFCGYIGSCVDVTDRKLAEEALKDLSGRMINAQEEERARIARELHDDFSQRLAIQCAGLEVLWKKLPESEGEERAKIQEMLKRALEISADMHSLSHQLHSSKLEHLGLAPALKGLCEEVSSKYNIEIRFTGSEVPAGIPNGVALCLFRIAQEALGNVVKHSRAKEARVELGGTNDEIRIQILDAGVGFDPSLRRARTGIGLVGMRERLRLVGGALSVQSAPMRGTEILARVPLPVPMNEDRARTQTAGQEGSRDGGD